MTKSYVHKHRRYESIIQTHPGCVPGSGKLERGSTTRYGGDCWSECWFFRVSRSRRIYACHCSGQKSLPTTDIRDGSPAVPSSSPPILTNLTLCSFRAGLRPQRSRTRRTTTTIQNGRSRCDPSSVTVKLLIVMDDLTEVVGSFLRPPPAVRARRIALNCEICGGNGAYLDRMPASGTAIFLVDLKFKKSESSVINVSRP